MLESIWFSAHPVQRYASYQPFIGPAMRLSPKNVLLLSCLVFTGGGCALTSKEIPLDAESNSNTPAKISEDAFWPDQTEDRRDRHWAQASDVDDRAPMSASRTAQDPFDDEQQQADNSIEAQLSAARDAGLIDDAKRDELRHVLQPLSRPFAERLLAQTIAHKTMGQNDASQGSDPRASLLGASLQDDRHPITAAIGHKTPDRRLAEFLRSATSSARRSRVRKNEPTKSSVRDTVPTDRQAKTADRRKQTTTDRHVLDVRRRVTSSSDSAVAESRVAIKSAIRSLEASIASSSESDPTIVANRQARLRMLYMLSGQRSQSMRPIPGVSPEENKFWSELIYGLSTYMGDEKDPNRPNPQRRASIASQHLRNAVASLSAQGNLRVHNLAFCSKVDSFGAYKKFDRKDKEGKRRYIFNPGQEVLVYAEIQNFTSKLTDDGYFHTSLKPSYAIVNARGEREFPVRDLDPANDYCLQQRHDFFERYRIYLPKGIQPGRYKLELEIVDDADEKNQKARTELYRLRDPHR